MLSKQVSQQLALVDELLWLITCCSILQVGVGAVERSHKMMKKVLFTEDRPSLSPQQANKECYIHFNIKRLDAVPDWIESYEEGSKDGVTPDSETAL